MDEILCIDYPVLHVHYKWVSSECFHWWTLFADNPEVISAPVVFPGGVRRCGWVRILEEEVVHTTDQEEVIPVKAWGVIKVSHTVRGVDSVLEILDIREAETSLMADDEVFKGIYR